MPSRANILESFGLPDRTAFEIEPHRDETGIWRIKVGSQGDPTKLMSQGHAAKLVDAIRSIDHQLADQIDACLEQARRYSSSPK